MSINAREFFWGWLKNTHILNSKNIDCNITQIHLALTLFILLYYFRSLQHFISWGKKIFSLCNWKNKEIISIHNIVLCVSKFHRSDILSVVSLNDICFYLTYVSISSNDYHNLFLHFLIDGYLGLFPVFHYFSSDVINILHTISLHIT